MHFGSKFILLIMLMMFLDSMFGLGATDWAFWLICFPFAIYLVSFDKVE